MINVDQITSRLAKLPDNALQQYAAMHKNDPYIMALAVAESNRRKEMRQAAQGAQGMVEPPKVADQEIAAMAPAPVQALPEDQGIARLPAGDMNFADGGIVAFAGGGSSRQNGGSAFDAALDAEGVRDPAERAFLKAIHLQESSGRKTASTSNRGARGPMQIRPGTFQSVADKGMDIDNPSDNMRAGIRYARQGYRAAGGDPVLAGAFYYGGPNGLEKARRGVAVPDPKNPKAPDTIGYGQSIAKRMTALLPISTAYAEPTPTAAAPAAPAAAPFKSAVSQIPGTTRADMVPPPARPTAPAAPALTREQMIAQIPGQDGSPVQVQPTPAPQPSVLDYLTAPFSKARALAQNTLAIPAAPVLSGLSQLRPQGGMSVEDAYRALMYSPTNPVAREELEATGRALTEDLKLPPYIPSLTPLRGPKAATAAETAAVTKAEAPRLGYTQPRLAPPTPQLAGVSPEAQGILRVHPDRLAALEKARLATQEADVAAALARQEANLARDKAAAAAAQGRITDANTGIAAARAVNEALPGQAARAGLPGLVGGVAQTTANLPAPEEAAPTDDSYARLEQKRLREKSFGIADLKPEAKEDIVEAAKEVTPAKKGQGFTGEDWLMLGLGLMSSKSPRFMSALGEAGLGAMKARQERAKEAREQESASVLDAYRKALGEQASAQAQAITSGSSKTKMALEAANTMYDNWVNTLKLDPLQQGIDPAVANAKYNQILRQVFSSFNIPVPSGLSVGSATQASPADLALVERYAGKT